MENIKLKLEKRWLIAFLLITTIAITALFWPHQSAVVSKNFKNSSALRFADIAWLLTASCLVLLMTPGLSFFYGGMVGKKNVISTMLKSFICLGIISVLWVTVGFSLSFGSPIGVSINGITYGIVGNPFDFAFFDQVDVLPHAQLGSTIPFILYALFQMKFAVITPAIITGALAERIRFVSFLLFICLFTLLIYAPLCHMIWHPNGLLGNYFGVKDFAGGTVVHMSAGFAALAGVLVLGKRKNNATVPTNIPFVLLGTGMLWFGWFGFNAGSALAANATAAMAFATTTIASATSMVTWVFFDRLHNRQISALGACIGAVVGLVVITPAAGYVTVPESIFFGFTGALLSNKMMHYKALKRFDDTLDVFACHGVGGIVGMLLTALFAHGTNVSLLHGGWSVFIPHLLALLLVSVFTFGGSYLLFRLTNLIIPIRVSDEAEHVGLDLSQHNERL